MAEPTTQSARNVALDNLRVVAMLLGLVTHGVLPFKATGVGSYPIHDCERTVLADACYFAVHDFRMQLFFVLAGFGALRWRPAAESARWPATGCCGSSCRWRWRCSSSPR